MTFEEIVDQAIDMVRRRGQVSYRMLKRQFELDDTYLDDLKYELIEIHQIAVDQDGKMLIWTGEATTTPEPSSPTVTTPPVEDHTPPPLSYTNPAMTSFTSMHH